MCALDVLLVPMIDASRMIALSRSFEEHEGEDILSNNYFG
jgi:hypothetical protein